MQRLLITGGAGFIGSHSVQAAQRDGYRVRVLDNLSTGDRRNLPDDTELIAGDITDADAVAQAVADCDAVLHLAALVSVPQSMAEPVATLRVNTEGTAVLIEAARQAGVRRFVLASTCAVYGDLPDRKDEASSVQPLSPYAASKLLAEQWLQLYARAYGMETVIFRYFNVYGPRQRADSPYSGVIAKWCAAAESGAPCIIFGDGEQTRDFVSVHDVAAANIAALAGDWRGEDGAWGSVFQVGVGSSVSLNQLLDALQQAAGHPIPRAYRPARDGDIVHSAGSSDRLRQRGWRPRVDLETGLRELLRDW
jgi:UDP-glucose 4-epimerase